MKIELHVHTSEGSPCAQADAQSIVRAYRDAGYGAIVITNHFDSLLLKDFGHDDHERIERYLLGYRRAKAVEKGFGVQVMLGVEIRLEPDVEDFLIYGVDEAFLFAHPDLCFMTQKQLFELCRAHGALLVQAHPFREPCAPRDPAYLDGVEFNQRPNSGNHNERLAAWIKDYPGLGRISGSDCHALDQVGFGGIEIEGEIGGMQALVERVRSGEYRLIGGQGKARERESL